MPICSFQFSQNAGVGGVGGGGGGRGDGGDGIHVCTLIEGAESFRCEL